MTLRIEKFNISTNASNDIIDITSKVENIVALANIKEGVLNLYCVNSDVALFSFKYDKTLISKLVNKLNKVFDREFNYKEGIDEVPDEILSLIKALTLGKNLTIPILETKLLLEKDNRIFLADFSKRAQNLTLTLTLTY